MGNITEPKKALKEIVEDYKGAFGEDLVSVILYGSAAGENYRPGRSDVNLMVALSEEGIDHLERAFKVVDKWGRKKAPVPLFLTERYLETSTDVFPIEYLSLRRNYIVGFGKDVFKGISVKPESLRLQCEREIKGKLLLLRRAFLQSSGKGKALRTVIADSIPAFTAIFRALLFLEGKEDPLDKRELFKQACEAFDLEVGLFESLIEIREGKANPKSEEIIRLYRGYLANVRKLANLVDQMGV